MSTYLNTKTVGVASCQQPDTVVGQAIDHLLRQAGLLLLALLFQVKVTAIRSVLQKPTKAMRVWL